MKLLVRRMGTQMLSPHLLLLLLLLLLFLHLSSPASTTKSTTRTITTNTVRCRTSQGDLVLRVHPAWAPLGAARFLQLVREGFYTFAPIYRCVPGFVLQWDHGHVEEAVHWDYTVGPIADDPQWLPTAQGQAHPLFRRGMVGFGGSGIDSRGHSPFITLSPQFGRPLDPHEVPFAEVTSESMRVLARLEAKCPYGDTPNAASAVLDQGVHGVLDAAPLVDYIHGCHVVTDAGTMTGGDEEEEGEAEAARVADPEEVEVEVRAAADSDRLAQKPPPIQLPKELQLRGESIVLQLAAGGLLRIALFKEHAHILLPSTTSAESMTVDLHVHVSLEPDNDNGHHHGDVRRNKLTTLTDHLLADVRMGIFDTAHFAASNTNNCSLVSSLSISDPTSSRGGRLLPLDAWQRAHMRGSLDAEQARRRLLARGRRFTAADDEALLRRLDRRARRAAAQGAKDATGAGDDSGDDDETAIDNRIRTVARGLVALCAQKDGEGDRHSMRWATLSIFLGKRTVFGGGGAEDAGGGGLDPASCVIVGAMVDEISLATLDDVERTATAHCPVADEATEGDVAASRSKEGDRVSSAVGSTATAAATGVAPVCARLARRSRIASAYVSHAPH